MKNMKKVNSLENVDRLLLEAMESEVKAKEFYLNASSKALSSTGKKLFQELANFEQHHYDKLKTIIEKRKQGLQ